MTISGEVERDRMAWLPRKSTVLDKLVGKYDK